MPGKPCGRRQDGCPIKIEVSEVPCLSRLNKVCATLQRFDSAILESQAFNIDRRIFVCPRNIGAHAVEANYCQDE